VGGRGAWPIDVELPGPTETAAGPGLRLYLFGPLRAYVGGQVMIDERFTRRKAKALLAYLYLKRGHYISKDELLEALWPNVDATVSGAGRLKQTVLVLRLALEGRKPAHTGWRYILEHGGSYYFNTQSANYSDVEEFQQELVLARADQERGDTDGARAHYQRLLALHQAELLPEFRYEDWAAVDAAAMREQYLQALEDNARLHGSGGEFGQAVELLCRAVREEPLRESSYIQLMEWLWRTGDHAAAVRVYLRLRETLASKLQLEPKPEAAALYHAIRRDRAAQGTAPPGGLSPAT
jgi:DNA-binding SARP family transcriptional activator